MPFLPGTPKKITSIHASSRISSAQQRPPSPGNIRPIKTERKPESEKKEIQQQPEKANEEKTDPGKTASSSAAVANEEFPHKPEIAHGETASVRSQICCSPWTLITFQLCIIWMPF